MSISALRSQSKKRIHAKFAEKCGYLAGVGLQPLAGILIRKYEQEVSTVGAIGESLGWAERQEQPIYMVFDNSEVIPVRGGVVTHPEGEYTVDIVLKSINGYTTCEVVNNVG
jgi:hypothetical protein